MTPPQNRGGIIRGRALSGLREAIAASEADDHHNLSRWTSEGIIEAAALMRGIPDGAALIVVTRAEARALLHALENSLSDFDFRRDHMSAHQRTAADQLAVRLQRVAYQRSET